MKMIKKKKREKKKKWGEKNIGDGRRDSGKATNVNVDGRKEAFVRKRK